MARPSKSSEIIENESKSHRTKAELELRRAAEQAALTGIRMHEYPETKADAEAHREYRRVLKILDAVGKNDALYESVINEYCMCRADIERYMQLRAEVLEENIPAKEKYNLVLSCDKQIDKYKRRRFDIEKENGMTIASSLRAIPKKVDKTPNPIIEALQNG